MKKNMARLLSTFLVLVLLFSCLNLGVFAAVPQDAVELTLDQGYTVEYQENKETVMKFTAPQAGMYAIWGENPTGGFDSFIRVNSADGDYLAGESCWGEGVYKAIVQLEAQETCVIRAAINYGGETGDYFIVTPSVQEPYDYTTYTDYVEITGCYVQDKKLVIPAELGGLPVTGIVGLGEALSFAEELVIPDSVTTLGNRALDKYEAPLKKLHLGKGVSGITGQTFSSLSKLEEITVSESSAAYAAVDGILYDKALTTLIAYPAGNKVTRTIPDSVTDIGELFANNYYCTIHVKTGAGIEDYITVDGIVYDRLKTEVMAAAAEKTGEVILPDTVTSVRRYGLADTKLSKITSTSVVHLAYGAYANNPELESVQLPGTLRSIDSAAFENCPNLNNTYIEDLAAWCEINYYDNPLAAGEGNLYLNNQKVTNLVLPSVIEAVYDRAFLNLNANSITVPSNIKEIGVRAFAGTAATQITLEEGIETIYYNAFSGSKLQAVELPNTLESLYGQAFYDCYNLQEVTFGSGLAAIEWETFAYTGLKTINIPENIEYVGESAFHGCKNLIYANMENENISIGSHAFYDCPLRDVDVSLAAGGYGYWAFSGNDTAFLYVPDGVTGLTYRCFQDNEHMLSVAIPASVTSINPYAFAGNTNISHVLYTGTEEQWNAITMEYEEWDYMTGGYVVVTTGCAELQNAPHIHFEAQGTEIYVTHTCTQIEHYCSICDETQIIEIPNGKHEFKEGICELCGYIQPKDGWEEEDGIWYYYEEGEKVTNDWRKDSIGWCYLTADGSMATNRWIEDSKGWCYVGADGYCLTNTWKQDSVGWVYLDQEGSMIKNDWVLSGGKWYFLDTEGYMVSNEWRKDSKGWCWLGADGAMATNTWVKDSKGWCYVGADGYCVTNCWKQDSVGWVYLDSEGSMVYSQWIADSVGWCYVGADGYMVTNDWTQDSNGWCYMDENGYCLTNTSRVIGGKTYYFNANGNCTNP